MPYPEQKTFQRQIAYKVRISDILSQSFAKDELSAGYIKLNNVNVSRVNIIAAVVYKSEDLSYASSVIDDGTGRISLRSFENQSAFSKTDVGDVILIIGKIREFNNEKYILPEILKKMNNIEWLNVRKAELKKVVLIGNGSTPAVGSNSAEDAGINDELYSLIKRLDKGDGVSIDDVIRDSGNSDAEKILNKLLENGDIFEIKPGKIKVLE